MTENVQLLLAVNSPLVKVNSPVPEICEPAPQTLLCGSPVATNPVNAASKSSVKVMLSMVLADVFSMVNSKSTVLPGATGSFVNSWTKFKPSITSKVSFAGSITMAPPTVAVKLLVMLL